MLDGSFAILDPSTCAGPSPVHAHATTLIDVVLAQGEELASRQVYAFDNADGQRQQASFAETALRSKAIGAALQRMITTGDRVLLLYPPGLGYVEAFFGCLFAGAIAVPAYPPLPNRPDQRLQALIEDAAPRVVLVPSAIMAFQTMLQAAYPALQYVEWVASDLISDALASAWQMPEVASETIAFLQYTSGSTGTPRGVQVTHANLLHNLAMIREGFGIGSEDHVVVWLPPYHDMGLIGGILTPMYSGCSVTLFSPLSFLQRPLLWLQLISQEKATIAGGPNFGYDLCARKLTAEQRETLDLKHWRVAFNGAEPIRASTLQRFCDTFGPHGFRPETFLPCYGLAESTLLVTGCQRSEAYQALNVDSEALREHRVSLREDGIPIVSSGAIGGAQDVLLVEPERLAECQDGQVGEIWIKGGSVCSGYWNRPVDSASTFGARMADGRGPYLRTGDLGFRWQQQLYVTGRIKDLIIIDGRNHYPQDLETTIEQAFAVEREEAEVVVVVAELQDPELAETAGQAVRRAIQNQHNVGIAELIWVSAGEIPKTSSGKLRRRECRARYLEGKLKLL
jgi:acyl-CoA synthetase (AMP-forming)/AMP-acid ligase II